MHAQIRIGARRDLKLQEAVLIYRDDGAAFATLHEVRAENGKTPYLRAGQPLTTGFLRMLAKGLGAVVAPEVLPENILARTPDLIVWWSRARRRGLFFGGESEEARRLDGRTYPHPALVFKIADRELFVRALQSDVRPTAGTPLKTAPYWNTDGPEGRVCLGSMQVPDEVNVDSIAGWERAYFESAFTHPTGAVRLTSHPGGFVGLWSALLDSQEPFPTKFLTDANQTLKQFVEHNMER